MVSCFYYGLVLLVSMLMQLNPFRICIFYKNKSSIRLLSLDFPFATRLELQVKSLCKDGEGQGSASVAYSTFPSMR